VSTADEPTLGAKCAGCNRDIDCCCFCLEQGCSVAVCYPCLMQELKQTLPQPHPHGG
jgi:hypothetical protein